VLGLGVELLTLFSTNATGGCYEGRVLWAGFDIGWGWDWINRC